VNSVALARTSLPKELELQPGSFSERCTIYSHNLSELGVNASFRANLSNLFSALKKRTQKAFAYAPSTRCSSKDHLREVLVPYTILIKSKNS